MHVGNWGVNPYLLFDQKVDYSFDEDDLSLLRGGLSQTGLHHLESDMILDIHRGDRRPLMALLLALLPNLAVIRAHVPSHDPYLMAVLQHALNEQTRGQDTSSLLGHLRELFIFAEVWLPAEIPEEENLSDTPRAPLKLDGLWPVLFLPTMRKLYLYDLETEGISTLIEKTQHDQTCYIDDLLLKTLDESSCRAADIRALIKLPKALLNCSLSINRRPGFRQTDIFKMPMLDIWKSLHDHQKELRYLDILYLVYHSNIT
ncbi:hypothetical protein BJY04DRAFT_217219 [Aspergillus karnatakaensis]|uniref:uncharacterized protein n=1 Tax=Aspergillus karnatakaensis TaxID=1810916 RepID=UPI003CCE0959